MCYIEEKVLLRIISASGFAIQKPWFVKHEVKNCSLVEVPKIGPHVYVVEVIKRGGVMPFTIDSICSLCPSTDISDVKKTIHNIYSVLKHFEERHVRRSEGQHKGKEQETL